MNRWERQVFTAELRKITAYRADFWIQYLANILTHIGVAFFLWQAVFTTLETESMQGYSFHSLMFYYLLVPLISRIIYGSELGAAAREIYDGSLTRYLIYPVSFFKYKLMQYCAHSAMYTIQMVAAVIFFIALFGTPQDMEISPLTLTIIPTLLLSVLLHYTFVMALELIAFWADNVWSLLVMVRFSISLLGGGLIPLAFFPEQLTPLINILPFRYLTAFPAELLMGRVESWQEWLYGTAVTAVWTLLLWIAGREIWRRGTKTYTGVGI